MTTLIKLSPSESTQIQLNKDDILLSESDSAFKAAFGFSASDKLRVSILSTKFHLSLSNSDVTALHKAGIWEFEPFCEAYLVPSRAKFIFALMEIICVPGIFFLIAYEAFLKPSLSSDGLIFFNGIALAGFCLFYYLFQSQFRPFYILHKRQVGIGQKYPASKKS